MNLLCVGSRKGKKLFYSTGSRREERQRRSNESKDMK
jgi:hypothetical protein